jgi:predicted transcriptional regulator
MRPTLRLDEEQKARLLGLAAERGERGCAKVVEEAVSRYLAALDEPAPARAIAATADTLMLPPLPEAQREKLLALAAARGEAGLTKVLQEAVAQYLDRQERRGVTTGALLSRAIVLFGQLWREPTVSMQFVARSLRFAVGRGAASKAAG